MMPSSNGGIWCACACLYIYIFQNRQEVGCCSGGRKEAKNDRKGSYQTTCGYHVLFDVSWKDHNRPQVDGCCHIIKKFVKTQLCARVELSLELSVFYLDGVNKI